MHSSSGNEPTRSRKIHQNLNLLLILTETRSVIGTRWDYYLLFMNFDISQGNKTSRVSVVKVQQMFDLFAS